MNKELMFSSKDDTWSTPQDFYEELNKEFNFKLDPCCNPETAKCKSFFTEAHNGLIQDWARYGTVFMNPPYGRGIKAWIEKAHNESQRGCVVVGLLPSRTDTRWFHDHIYGKAEIRFIKGRLKFGGHKNPAPFPSMIVIWTPPVSKFSEMINAMIKEDNKMFIDPDTDKPDQQTAIQNPGHQRNEEESSLKEKGRREA